MNLRAATEADWTGIRTLLESCGLPLAGAREHLANFAVAVRDGRIAGCAGFEDYGPDILLRSVAVDPAVQGSGLGSRLVRHVLDRARSGGAKRAVLLTATASSFFPKFGFRAIAREEAPETVRASAEFQGACPASAVAMIADL